MVINRFFCLKKVEHLGDLIQSEMMSANCFVIISHVL